jgi:hypothetical protein
MHEEIHADEGIMPAWARSLHSKIDRLDVHITGGSEPSRGLNVRVDRLEQSEVRKNWWATTAMGGAIAAMIASGWALLTGKHG